MIKNLEQLVTDGRGQQPYNRNLSEYWADPAPVAVFG